MPPVALFLANILEPDTETQGVPWLRLLLTLLGTGLLIPVFLAGARRWPTVFGRMGVLVLLASGVFIPWLAFGNDFFELFIGVVGGALGCMFLSRGFGVLSLVFDEIASETAEESFQIHWAQIRRGVICLGFSLPFGLYWFLDRALGIE